MGDEVIEFIGRRFKKDCNWLDGNCYFFAQILKARFPEAILFYDAICGHFVVQIGDAKYDWTGKVDETGKHCFIQWDKFKEYDSLQMERIERDCIR